MWHSRDEYRVTSAYDLAPYVVERGEPEMKFSREFQTEDQARALERALQGSGCRAWCTRKPDGAWEVFWLAAIEANAA